MRIREEKRNNNSIVKKVILIALLLAVLLFLFIERDYLRNEKRVHLNLTDASLPTQSVSVIGDHVIEQQVVMRSDSIKTIHVYFLNPAGDKATGKISLELLDSKGEVLQKTDIDASLVRRNRYTNLQFGGDAAAINYNKIVGTYGSEHNVGNVDVVRGATYTFRISTKDIKSDEDFRIVLSDYSTTGDSSLVDASIDGKSYNDRCLYMAITERSYSYKTIALIILLILAALIFVLLPFDRIDELLEKKTGRTDLFSRTVMTAMFIISPLVAYFITQKFVGYGSASFVRHITDSSGKGILNLIIIGFVWWLIYTICNRLRITSVLIVLIYAIFGFVNYALVLFRDTPLIATDFSQIGTAMQVANSYSLTYNKPFLWAIILTVVWVVAALAPSEDHKNGRSVKKTAASIVILAIWAGVFYYTFFVSSYLGENEFRVSGFKPKYSYMKNGCPMSFLITVKNSIIKKPRDYDAESIEALEKQYPSDNVTEAERVSKDTPNVIVVMNESFSDLSVLGTYETNQEVIPFYNSLKENTIKGWMHSSVFGGSTANSEFECLTGFTVKFLPFMSVPYRSIIRDRTPSMAEYMKELNYGGNVAFHPGMLNSYNRDKVYPLLGFDSHIAYENLEEPDKIRDFVSDEYDYEYVEKTYEEFRKTESDKPFYMFNVTIQNHGGYGLETGKVDAGIEVLSQDCQQKTFLQFLNLMKLSDEALEQLIEYYSNVDEETVIVLFGDHQPRISEEFYNVMRGQREDLSEIEWSDMQHRVPFMIWANYDINEANGGNAFLKDKGDGELHLSANYIAPVLKKAIGLPMTGFDKYLLDLYEELPVINAVCYNDADGTIYNPEEPSKYDVRLNEYEQIQYNGLIDTRNRAEEFFSLKK